jgi:hypothetical protein
MRTGRLSTQARVIRLRGRTVWRLALRAEPFVDTPNSVLRRLLGLDPPRRRQVAGQRPSRQRFPAWRICRVDAEVYRRLAERGGPERDEGMDAVVWALLHPRRR